MLSKVFKILGRLSDPEGAGVVGHNTAKRGAAIGVEGKTESDEGYGLYTEDDARVDGEMTTPALTAKDIVVDFVGEDGGDHGVEVIDNSTDNSEQIGVKADPEGSAEVVFQDTDESNYKWGFRVNSSGEFFLENQDNLQSRVRFGKQGDTEFISRDLTVSDDSGTEHLRVNQSTETVETTAVGIEEVVAAANPSGGNQTVPPGTTTVELDEAEVDDWGAVDTGTDSIDVPADGKYRITAAATWDTLPDGTRSRAEIHVDGSTKLRDTTVTGATGRVTTGVTGVQKLSAGDAIGFRIDQDSADDQAIITGYASSRLDVVRIG